MSYFHVNHQPKYQQIIFAAFFTREQMFIVGLSVNSCGELPNVAHH